MNGSVPVIKAKTVIVNCVLSQQQVPPPADNQALARISRPAHSTLHFCDACPALDLTGPPVALFDYVGGFDHHRLQVEEYLFLSVCDLAIDVSVLFVQHFGQIVTIELSWVLNKLQSPFVIFWDFDVVGHSDQVSHLRHEHYSEI